MALILNLSSQASGTGDGLCVCVMCMHVGLCVCVCLFSRVLCVLVLLLLSSPLGCFSPVGLCLLGIRQGFQFEGMERDAQIAQEWDGVW